MKITKKTNIDVTETLTIKPINSQSKGEYFSKLQERVTTTVSKDQLESLYHIDGLFFRAINDYVDKVVGPGYYLEGDKTLVKVCDKWLDNIKGKRVFEEIIKDIFVSGAGNAWLELGYNSKGTDIPSVRIINPKLMDYIRDKQNDNNVVLDITGDPKGFCQTKTAYKHETTWTKEAITVNGDVTWTASTDEDGRDRIAHFKLFGLGDSYLGNSPSEAIYKQAIIRLNLEDNTGTSVHQSGGIIATVGSPNPNNPAMLTPAIMDKVASDLQNVDMQSVFAFPQGTKIDRMPSPDMADRLGLLIYFAAIQNIGLGIPTTRYALPGVNSNVGNSTSINSDIDFEQRIIAIQDRLAELIRDKLLYRMLKARGLVDEYADTPKFIFRIHTSSILSESINMLSKLGRRDMIRRDPKLEKYIREQLALPTEYLDREIDQWEKDDEKIPSNEKGMQGKDNGNKNIDIIPKDPKATKEPSKEDIKKIAKDLAKDIADELEKDEE